MAGNPGLRQALCTSGFPAGAELWAWAAGWHQGLCLARRNWWGKLSQKWGYPGPTKQKRLFPPDEAQGLTTSWIACLERSPSGDRRAQVHPGSHQDKDSKGPRGVEACSVSHSKGATGWDLSTGSDLTSSQVLKPLNLSLHA